MGHEANISVATPTNKHATRSATAISRMMLKQNTRWLCANDNTCHGIKNGLRTSSTLWDHDDRDVTPTLGCTTLTDYILSHTITMHRESDLQRHRITAKAQTLLYFLSQRGTKSTPKGGVLDDLLYINNGGNRHSIIAELNNQPVNVDIVGNLIQHREPGCHLAQIHLMTKMEISHGQGLYGSMVESMATTSWIDVMRHQSQSGASVPAGNTIVMVAIIAL